ncbi:zonular occludens toxin domain-containing protein [Methylobacillus arboreus]|uniref:zonular occludens toxin domain-containing protein n=1 Tax=Methylobacillus arboreus TaxID=755170 RepID=UPI001E6082B9|nr:zonular occludens toxin domain-containing protein [Methylobacillus arboreus]MCB5189797.1 zonular occludens toxin domain-containing protein [Methylobacillus arboreus]
MITLITGQPGNGKSALTVWQYIRPEVEKRTVYCVGIPKLTLPVIPISRAELERWHELEPKKNPDDEDEVPLLKNIQEGSLIVVDECQKSFKPTGTTMQPFIEYLCEHRHHGLDFVVITQFPHLVHKTVRALVTKHIHVRSTWRGRSLHEWPEWQENPHTKSNLAVATTTRYTIPKEVFGMYESASIHTKVKHKIPMAFKLFVLLLVVVPMLGYMAVQRVKAKTGPNKPDAEIVQEETMTKTVLTKIEAMTPEQMAQEQARLNPDQVEATTLVIQRKLDMVSDAPWAMIGACVDFRGECRCYGDEGQRVDVSEAACRSGIENKWSGRGMPAQATTRRNDEAES